MADSPLAAGHEAGRQELAPRRRARRGRRQASVAAKRSGGEAKPAAEAARPDVRQIARLLARAREVRRAILGERVKTTRRRPATGRCSSSTAAADSSCSFRGRRHRRLPRVEDEHRHRRGERDVLWVGREARGRRAAAAVEPTAGALPDAATSCAPATSRAVDGRRHADVGARPGSSAHGLHAVLLQAQRGSQRADAPQSSGGAGTRLRSPRLSGRGRARASARTCRACRRPSQRNTRTTSWSSSVAIVPSRTQRDVVERPSPVRIEPRAARRCARPTAGACRRRSQ